MKKERQKWFQRIKKSEEKTIKSDLKYYEEVLSNIIKENETDIVKAYILCKNCVMIKTIDSFYKQMYALRFGEEIFREEYFKISNTTYIDNNYQKQIVDDKYFVTSTAYGDGAYQVFVKKNKDGKIIGIKIDYEKDMSDYE